MATLFLPVGLPGSGKTTVAKQLEREQPALRLTSDEWITALHGSNPSEEDLDRAREPVEALQWNVAARALSLGVNVVLDFGLWTRAEREDFRARAASLGARSELRFSETTLGELLRRITDRNRSLPPDAFHVTEAQMRQWWNQFEPPSPEELVPREAP